MLLSGLLATEARAKCDPDASPDSVDIASTRAAVAEACSCSAAATHGSYVSCAAETANETLTNKSCAKYVKKCAAKSTCGKPGFVTCCITNDKGTKCKTKKDAEHCLAKEGVVGTCSSCCDACPTPGAGASCPVPTSTTTSSTTTTTIP